MNVLFLTFGDNIQNHYQANFAILSLLKDKSGINRIYVYTDRPQYYSRYLDYVQVVPISEEMMKDWKGPYDFFWRLKLKAMEDLVRRHPDMPMLFLDSDTFLYTDLAHLTAPLQQGKALMHVAEGLLSQLKSKTERRMWSKVNGLKVGDITINAGHTMWNSGVLGLPAARNQQTIELAIQLCDTMRAQDTTRMIEQFALSIALTETYPMEAANATIGHYWGNKGQWNERITQFYMESFLKAYTVEQDVARLQEFDYGQLPLILRVKTTHKRLSKAIDKLFPARATQYVGEHKERKR
ncbi:hypothetical protein ACXYMU_01465 [Pontibacter sp. CAU 1760]